MFCRLLQPGHVGAEDGPGGPRRAGEDQSPCSGAAHGPVSRHLDSGGVTLVHLPLHRRPPDRGEETLGFNVTAREAHPLTGPFFILSDGPAGLGLSLLRGVQGSLPGGSDAHNPSSDGDPASALTA